MKLLLNILRDSSPKINMYLFKLIDSVFNFEKAVVNGQPLYHRHLMSCPIKSPLWIRLRGERYYQHMQEDYDLSAVIMQ